MRRRAIGLILTMLLPIGLGGHERAVIGREEATPYDWGVAYYMSYDNNLEVHGPTILGRIADGITTGRTVAAVQADFRDPGGMRRYTVRSSGLEMARVDSEDSANEDRLIDYLSWFVATFRCRRYAVVILNHGGKLDAMCLDESSGDGSRRWMSGRRLGEKLRNFGALSGRCELLFLQQCGRATVENLYSFRGAARYVMASPVNVGAPNTYYTAFHRWLEQTPEATGAELSTRIAALDEDYTVYACARSTALAELPRRLDRVLAPMLARPDLVAPRSVPIIFTSGQTVDAGEYLRRLAEANHAGGGDVDAFLKWVSNDLFTGVWRREPAKPGSARLVGLGLYPPCAGEDCRGRGLDLDQESLLPALWQRLEATGANPAASDGSPKPR